MTENENSRGVKLVRNWCEIDAKCDEKCRENRNPVLLLLEVEKTTLVMAYFLRMKGR